MKAICSLNTDIAALGESNDRLRYRQYADRAEREGFHNIARLFRAIAYAEDVHAKNHLNARENVESTPANLRRAINSERYQSAEMYPAFALVAGMQQESLVQVSMQYALQAEKTHVRLFERALEQVEAGEDFQPVPMLICPECGHFNENNAPDQCPVCGTRGSHFRRF